MQKNIKVVCISKSDNVFDTYEEVKKLSLISLAFKCDISKITHTFETLSSIDLLEEK